MLPVWFEILITHVSDRKTVYILCNKNEMVGIVTQAWELRRGIHYYIIKKN